MGILRNTNISCKYTYQLLYIGWDPGFRAAQLTQSIEERIQPREIVLHASNVHWPHPTRLLGKLQSWSYNLKPEPSRWDRGEWSAFQKLVQNIERVNSNENPARRNDLWILLHGDSEAEMLIKPAPRPLPFDWNLVRTFQMFPRRLGIGSLQRGAMSSRRPLGVRKKVMINYGAWV